MLELTLGALTLALLAVLWRLGKLRDDIHDLYMKDSLADDTLERVKLFDQAEASNE